MPPEQSSQRLSEAKAFLDFSYFIEQEGESKIFPDFSCFLKQEGKTTIHPDFSCFAKNEEENTSLTLSLKDSSCLATKNSQISDYNDMQNLDRRSSYFLPPGVNAFQNQVNDGAIRYQGIPPHELVFDPHSEKAFFCFGSDGLDKYVGKEARADGHILVLGGSGSGKTTGIALPTLQTWKGPIFTFDFKGDLTAWAKEMGRAPKVLYLLDGWENDFFFDPYDLLRKGGENHVIENAREIAEALIPSYSENEQETFWIYAARGLLSAAIVYYFRLGLDFIETMLLIKRQSTDELVQTIRGDELAIMCLLGDLLGSKEETAGISTEIHNHILDFVSSSIVINALSTSPAEHKGLITLEDLAHEDIFIQIDQSRVPQWNGLIRLILVQLIKTLERRPEKYAPEGQQIEPTLLLLDEFPQYGRIKELTSAMKVLRSKNVTFSLFCQSFADLEETYGKTTRETVIDNCSYLAILGAQDPQTSQSLSEMVGTHRGANSSISCNTDIYGRPQGFSMSYVEEERLIIRPEELKTLNQIILLNPYGHGFCRVEKNTQFQKDVPELIQKKEGKGLMKTSVENQLKEAQKKEKFLENRRKCEKKKEAERKTKCEAHRRFLIGERLTHYFPQLLDNCSEGQEADEVVLKQLDSILYVLSMDSAMLESLKMKAQEQELICESLVESNYSNTSQ